MSDRTEYSYDLFVSYAEADSAWVEGYFLDALRDAGARCHSEAAFALGVPRLAEFERAIRQSRRTLLVLSPAYLSDRTTLFVDLLAQSYGLEMTTWPVIPLILHSVGLPPRLEMLTSLDATDSRRWSEVIEGVCLELQRPVPQPSPRLACPYPGMVPFSARDARFFCGREAEIQQVLQHLRHQRLLFIIGSSGSGKSSLVNAGLLPRLRDSTFFPPGSWLVRLMRPGSQPLQTLSHMIGADLTQPDPAVSDLLDAHPPAQRLLLVLDQFEELFTQADRPEQTRFIAVLQGLRAIESCALVIVLRADFYSDLMTSDLWPLALSERLEIAPLRGDALRDVIEKPAERQRVYLEARLVERILADAADEPGVLPLVQETMVRLWDMMERHLIPLSAYERLGSGGRSGLSAALVTKADATLAELSDQQQAIARRMLLRLVQFGVGRADTRRQQAESALRSSDDDPQVFDQTLLHLAANRLLTLSGGEQAEDRMVDIAHEALFSGWPVLQGWLSARREAEQTRRRLEAKADEWVRLGRDRSGLLDDLELREATNWLESSDAADLGYDETLPALVRASRTAIEEAEREQEAARQRELEQARALAEEQRRRAETESQRAAEQARGRRRLRRLAIGLAAVFLLAVGAALFAGGAAWYASEQQQGAVAARATAEARLEVRNTAVAEAVAALETAEASEAEAQRQFRVRIAGQLAAQSQVAPAEVPQAALLLAVEAYNLAYQESQFRLPAVEQALHDVLRRSGGLPLLGHTNMVYAVAFSPDGKWLATGSADSTVRLWQMVDPAAEPLELSNRGSVKHLSFSPDGRWLATAGGSVARLWNMDDPSAAPFTLSGHEKDIWALDFSHDGNWLATAGLDQTARLWDITNPTAQGIVLRGHTEVVKDVVFSPDSQWLATASSDHTARLWRVADPVANPVTLDSHQDSVNAVAFSSDGRWLATASDDNTTHLREMGNLAAPPAILEDQPPGVHALAFSPRGIWLATVASSSIRLWDMRDPDVGAIKLHNPGEAITRIAFSADGHWLAAGTQSGTACLWDISNPESEPALLYDHEPWVTSVAFSPDGHWLATGSYDNTARLWPVSSPYADPLSLPGHEDVVSDLAFSSDGQWLATASYDETARLWNMDDPMAPPVVFSGHEGTVGLVALSYDGRWLATAADETARLWQVAEPTRPAIVLSGHEAPINALAFSPGCEIAPETSRERYGCWLATASGDRSAPEADNTVRLWPVDEPAAASIVLHGHEDRVTALSFSPGGQWIATASEDGTVRVWDMADLTAEPLVLRGNQFGVDAVAFSPDGRWLAAPGFYTRLWPMDAPSAEPSAVLHSSGGSHDEVVFSPDGQWLATDARGYTILLWSMSDLTAAPVPLRGHEHGISDLAFSPESRWLASGSLDGTVRLWDLSALAAPPVVLTYLGSAVWDVAFSPDGSRLAGSGNDRSVRLWLVQGPDLAELACLTAGRNLYEEEWEQYFAGETYRRTCPDWPADPAAVAHLRARVVRLVRDDDLESAEDLLHAVRALDPSAIEPDIPAARYAARQVIWEGLFAAGSRQIPEAIALFTEAQTLDPTYEPSADSWDALCRLGSLGGHAVDVLDACEQAVAQAPMDAAKRDSRGIARAVIGDVAGAIDDFVFVVTEREKSDQDSAVVQQRASWVRALKAGESPLDEATLEGLRDDAIRQVGERLQDWVDGVEPSE